jgi:hypothetical protein
MQEVEGGRHFQISRVISTGMKASVASEYHERALEPQPTHLPTSLI